MPMRIGYNPPLSQKLLALLFMKQSQHRNPHKCVPGWRLASMETLTMYKPNFCAECGERIMRPRWHLWTSRRFCPDCAPRLRNARLLWPMLAGLALFILGLGAGRAVRPVPPPLIIERRQPGMLPAQTAQAQPPSGNTQTASSSTPTRPEPVAKNIATERPVDSPEIISTCGALTKKGTPCQRRVRGTGRCWQHKGQPAMIPLEQRLIAEK